MGRPPDLTWVDTALHYAEHGWELLPFHRMDARGNCTCEQPDCSIIGDHSRFEDWSSECSSVEQDIRAWADIWREANVGVVPGPASDLIVLEASQSPDGTKALGRLLTGPLPQTPSAVENEATHYFFFAHPGQGIPAEIRLAPGLRLLGDGTPLRLPRQPWWNRGVGLVWRESPGMTPVASLPDELAEAADLERPVHGPPLMAAEASDLPFRTPDVEAVERSARVEWIVDRWLPAGSLTLVVGPPKCGKTTWMLELIRKALAVGNGSALPQCIYVTGQSPQTFNAAFQKTGFGERELQAVHVLCGEETSGLSLAEVMHETAAYARSIGAVLVVLDQLDVAVLGNTGGDELPVLESIQPLLREGIAVACVHTGEPDPMMLCSSPRIGRCATASDTIFSLVPSPHTAPRYGVIQVASRYEAIREQAEWFSPGAESTPVVPSTFSSPDPVPLFSRH